MEEEKQKFIKRLKKISGSIMLYSNSFDSPHSRICHECVGGMWAIGDTHIAIPWESDWGKLLSVYLLGNEKESQEAYKKLQMVEEKGMLTEHTRLESKKKAMAQIKNPKLKGFIYVVKSKNLYKIGRAKHPKSRIKTYRTENPFGITVIFQKEVDDYVGIEEKLLDTFKEKRIKGEWFNLTPENIQWIKQNI
jgi:hypothetical protein